MRYLKDCLGHNNIDSLTLGDAGLFSDYLLGRGMSSSSVSRVIASVRAILNLAIKEYGLSGPNIFNGLFIPKDLYKRAPPHTPCRNLKNSKRMHVG